MSQLDRVEKSLGELTGKVECLDRKFTAHAAEDRGRREATGETMGLDSRKIARWSAIGTWIRNGLVAIALLVAAALFVASSQSAADQERPDELAGISARLDSISADLKKKRIIP